MKITELLPAFSISSLSLQKQESNSIFWKTHASLVHNLSTLPAHLLCYFKITSHLSSETLTW